MKEILLDCDGVLADFISPVIARLNAYTGKNITLKEYAAAGNWMVEQVFGITFEEFWREAERGDNLWCDLKPYPWSDKVLDICDRHGRVTICTSPSLNPICAAQKVEWIQEHLGRNVTHVMLGSRKDLMARPGNVLIDDYPSNIDKFVAAGGQGILVPSDWNTYPLVEEDVLGPIREGLV